MRAIILIGLFFTAVVSSRALAGASSQVSPGYSALSAVGPHSPIFRVEKSENPQNILVAYTKLRADCALDEMPKETAHVDYYWLMDGLTYKRVHPLIKSGIRDRLEAQPAPTAESFAIRLTDLKELDQGLGETIVKVGGRRAKDGTCEARAMLRLGPSDQSRTIQLNSIYTDSRKTLWPPFRKINSITLKGKDEKTGEPVSRQYFAR